MKKLSLLLSAVIWLSASGAVRPLAIGGYHHEAKRVASEVAVKNCWLYKLTTPTPAEYKNYSVVYLGELLKNAKNDIMWNTPENRKHVMEYLNNGGVIVTSKNMPRALFGKTIKKEAGKIFGFNSVFVIKPNAVTGVRVKGIKDTVIWNKVAAVGIGGVAPDVEVLATYVSPEGKETPAVTRRKVGKGEIWWIAVPLNRLTEAFRKVSLGEPDEAGRFIPTKAGEALEALNNIYRQAFLSGKDIACNEAARSWGEKPLGTPGKLKLNDKFKNRAELRSGFPARKPGLVICDDKVQAVIYPASSGTIRLARELKFHLDKISGRNFQIVRQYPDDVTPAIIIGDAETAAKFDLKPQFTDRDTILIRRKGKHLLIGGLGTGISQALTVFLESLGCRYLWPGATGKVIPKMKNIIAPELDVNYPAKLYMVRSVRENGFRYHRWANSIKMFGFEVDEMEKLWKKMSHDAPANRGFFQWHGINEDPRRFGWEKQKGNIYEWGHAFNHFYRVHGKKYPQVFSLQPDGSRKQGERPRLCHSNEQLIKLIAAEKIAVFKNNPHKIALSLCLNDGGHSSMCLCENCRKLDPVNAFPQSLLIFKPTRRTLQYVSLADRVLHFSNAIAEEVLKEVPGKKFTFYAYAEYERPPVKVKPHPSFVIFSVAGGYASEARRQQALKTVASWANFGNPILWRPNALYGFRDAIMPQHYGRKIFNDLELFKANNIIGDDVDGFEMQWACKGLGYYFFSKAQWNHEGIDYDTWFNDYCEKGFNAAAPVIKEYFMLLEKLSNKAAAEKLNYLELVDEKNLAAMDNYIAKAREAARGDAEVLARIDFLERGLTVGKLCRKLHYAKKTGSADLPAVKKEFIKTVREITLVDPVAVNPEKIGFYSPYLK